MLLPSKRADSVVALKKLKSTSLRIPPPRLFNGIELAPVKEKENAFSHVGFFLNLGVSVAARSGVNSFNFCFSFLLAEYFSSILWRKHYVIFAILLRMR